MKDIMTSTHHMRGRTLLRIHFHYNLSHIMFFDIEIRKSIISSVIPNYI
jgi:hypothetical protein